MVIAVADTDRGAVSHKPPRTSRKDRYNNAKVLVRTNHESFNERRHVGMEELQESLFYEGGVHRWVVLVAVWGSPRLFRAYTQPTVATRNCVARAPAGRRAQARAFRTSGLYAEQPTLAARSRAAPPARWPPVRC